LGACDHAPKAHSRCTRENAVTRALLGLGLTVLALAGPAHAHHSFGAFYFEDQSVSIEGDLTEFRYVNPHAWVYIAARDNDGVSRQVGAEWANPSRLNQQGIRKDTLKPGDHVIITGSPAREPSEYKLHLKRIERPADGWKWAGGRERR
jgi:hypothetical protein